MDELPETDSTKTSVRNSSLAEVIAEPIPEAKPKAKKLRLKSVGRAIKGGGANHTVWIMTAVAVLFLLAGIAVSQFVISPSQAAAEAEPPEAGPITVPVELREISNDIITRGDVVYDDAVSVTLQTGDIGGPAVVTGAIPEAGKTLESGDVALEVVGRPVIVLPGELPAYRTLVAGTSGPDVEQLRTALRSLGFDVGEGNTYDSALSSAVGALFAQAGYAAPAIDPAISEALKSAQDGVTSAEQAYTEAETALQNAGGGPNESTRVQLENGVNAASRALNDAKACAANPPPEGCAVSVDDAQEALNLAIAERDDGLAPASVDGEVAARDAAWKILEDAKEQLGEAQADALTPLPVSEILYLSNLPRRIDSVKVKRGQILDAEPAFSVSGANIEVQANISSSDADLLKIDDSAELDLDGTPIPAKVTKIDSKAGSAEADSDSAKTLLTLVPDTITEEQRSQMTGINIKVTIPVSATDGKVLAVPVAALTAGPGGETRVEVLRDGTTEPELVTVETGLTAKGFAEIKTKGNVIKEGDQVIVGNATGNDDTSD
jgi:hypothetical protein